MQVRLGLATLTALSVAIADWLVRNVRDEAAGRWSGEKVQKEAHSPSHVRPNNCGIMSRSLVAMLAIFLVLGMVRAIALEMPAQTLSSLDYLVHGVTPRPTDSPMKEELGLLKRDNSDGRTCGYVSAIESQSIVCVTGYSCFYDSIISVLGCAPNSQQLLATTCLDFTERSRCSGSCAQTTGSLICNSVYPYCNLGKFTDGYEILYCDVTSGIQSLAYTYTDGAAATSVNGGLPTTTTSNVASPSTTTTNTHSFGSTSSPASAATTTIITAPGKSKAPVGAIVGGVVGGLLGLALIGALVVFLVFRRKPQSAPAAVPNQPQMNQGGPPAGQFPSGGAAPVYSPVYSPVQGYDQSRFSSPTIASPTPQSMSSPSMKNELLYSQGQMSPMSPELASSPQPTHSSAHEMASPTPMSELSSGAQSPVYFQNPPVQPFDITHDQHHVVHQLP